jgi:hypothetical protein
MTPPTSIVVRSHAPCRLSSWLSWPRPTSHRLTHRPPRSAIDDYWKARPLKDDYFVYVWMDGIYIGASIEKEKSCLLTLVGARSDGTKELIAMELGYRESEASWGDVFRSLRDRGMRCPVLFHR